MTIEQFVQLSEMEQVAAIMQFGTLMMQDGNGERRVFVYRLDHFLVFTSYGREDDRLLAVGCMAEAGETRRVNPAERAASHHL